MKWLEITIQTASEGIELLAAYLGERGYDSLSVIDETEFREFLEDTKPNWDYVDETLDKSMTGVSLIRYYSEDNEQTAKELVRLQNDLNEAKRLFPAVNFGSMEIVTRVCQDEDWENNWKAFYKPIPIGEKLIVIPEWLTDCDTGGRIPVILDPGLIFGTGQHASTQMCLLALQDVIRGSETVLDLGSGSGILAIASLLLGAKSALAIDIDPKAEDVARQNAARNRLLQDRFTAQTGNVLSDTQMVQTLAKEKHTVVIANIVADVIIGLSRFVTDLMESNGTMICSGIIDTRENEVAAELEANGLTIQRRIAQDGWRCFVCRKKGDSV